MQTRDLELYSTKELVDELMRRQTFLGVVVHSEQELKSTAWSGERMFKVHFNSNLDANEVCLLLGTVTNHIDRSRW